MIQEWYVKVMAWDSQFWSTDPTSLVTHDEPSWLSRFQLKVFFAVLQPDTSTTGES